MSEAGLNLDFVQDNFSRSTHRGVVRGLHYQLPPAAQYKLIAVTRGAIFDVVVDIRKESKTLGHWLGLIVSGEDWNQLLVPPGFAHGFVTLETDVDVHYKVSAPYRPDLERTIYHDDPCIGIDWPVELAARSLSERDRSAPMLADADLPATWE